MGKLEGYVIDQWVWNGFSEPVVSWSLRLMSNQRPHACPKACRRGGWDENKGLKLSCGVIAPYTAQASYNGKPGRTARLFGIRWWSCWNELAEKVTGEGLEGLEADQWCWLLMPSGPRSTRSRNLLQRLHSLPNTKLEKIEAGAYKPSTWESEGRVWVLDNLGYTKRFCLRRKNKIKQTNKEKNWTAHNRKYSNIAFLGNRQQQW